MTPSTAYQRLNRVLWLGRLPKATVILVDAATIPNLHGITLHNQDIFVKPLVVLNSGSQHWGLTLVHEMLHIAEPNLAHGEVFDKIVNRYWRIAKVEVFKKHKKSAVNAIPTETE